MSYDVTKSRMLQWIGILLLLAVFAGAYWYFQVRASTLNQSQNDFITNGLVGLWSFNGDDISGTTAYDRSSTGANGTLTGGPAKIVGKVGQALDFDGTDDYVSVADNAALDFGDTADFSLSGWFYRDTFTTDDAIIAKRNGITAGDTGYIAYIDDATDQLIFEVSDGTDEYSLTSTSTFTATGWYHYAIVWDQDSATNTEIYINGVANVATDSGTIGNIGDLGNAVVLAIGSESDAGAPFEGKLDEVRVYNRALSASEIQSLSTQGGGTKVGSAVSQPQGTGRLDSGLAGYWKLDENTGLSASDSSTNGNNGSISGWDALPSWVSGQIGSALNFTTTVGGNWVNVPDADTIDVTDGMNFSLSGWFNRDTFTIDSTILAKSNGQIAADTGYTIYIDDTTDKVTFVANDGTDQYKLESTSTFTATGWHHLVVVWNDSVSTETKLYINGVAEAATATGTFANVNSLANTLPLRIGNESDGGAPFSGSLDDIRMYNRALSADEAGQLYRLTSPTGTDTGLKGYWSFNGQDISGTTAYDRSGAGNTATLTNGPTKVIGVLGQALSFDGSDDYVTVPDNSVLDVGSTADITLTGWFYRNSFTTDDTIIAKRNGITAGDTGYIAYIDDATDQLIFEVSDGTDEYSLTSTSTFTATGWYHYAIVWDQDSATNTEIYINGVASNATDAGTIGNVDDLSNALTLNMGEESDNGNPFDGKLDEVRVYNQALSANQIKSLYDAVAPDKGNSSASQAQGTGRLDSGLAGYWKLDETTGSNAPDASTNGNAGTLQNMENGDWTTGQIGGGLDFDGTTEYVSTGKSVPNQGTMSAWVNTTASIDTGDEFYIMGATAAGNSIGVSFNSYGGFNNWNFYMRGGYGTLVNIAGPSYTTNAQQGWHHLTVTWDVSKGASLYLDGALIASTATTTSNFDAMSFVISSSDSNVSWIGKLDEARMYDRVLSADEVVQLYRLTNPTAVDTGLKGYWSFNGQDISGTTAYDRSGVGNTGTLTGPTKVPGKLGQALNFDGSNDYVASVTNSTSLSGITQASIAFWIYPRGASYQGGIFKSMVNDSGGNAFSQGFEVSGDSWAGTQTIRFGADSSGGDMMARSTTTLSLNTWTYVVVVWDGSLTAANVKFYLNGVLDTTVAQFNGSGSYVASDGSFQIGTQDGGGLFDGKLDEVRVYNRQLTASEVSALYNSSR